MTGFNLVIINNPLALLQLDLHSQFWVRDIRHTLFNSVEISIGGSVIDRQYGEFLSIWNQLRN